MKKCDHNYIRWCASSAGSYYACMICNENVSGVKNGDRLTHPLQYMEDIYTDGDIWQTYYMDRQEDIPFGERIMIKN